ncbi:MAG: hypothetical protein R2697_08885 [Ilumatobacteraceae bacterium]
METVEGTGDDTVDPDVVTTTADPPDVFGGYTVHADEPTIRIDDRLLGTNIPAWLGPDLIEQDWFREALVLRGHLGADARRELEQRLRLVVV